MKEVSYKELGKELIKKIRKQTGFKGFLLEDTDAWCEEIQHSEEYGHFEFQGQEIELEVKYTYDENDMITNIQYFI